jgi:uncharacterized membrane protein
MRNLLRFYLTFRNPKNFLWVLVIFLSVWLTLHFINGFDSDFGAINLILSVEASIAGAVLMMVAERSSAMQQRNNDDQGKMIAAMLALAEAQRQLLTDHAAILIKLKEGDETILQALIKTEVVNDVARYGS